MKKSQLITLPYAIGEQLWVNLGPDGVLPCVFAHAFSTRSMSFSEDRFFFILVEPDLDTVMGEIVLDDVETSARVFRKREAAETSCFRSAVCIAPCPPRTLSTDYRLSHKVWKPRGR